jgi:hypothetical protein
VPYRAVPVRHCSTGQGRARQHRTGWSSVVQHSTVLYCTVQFSSAHSRTEKCRTVKYSAGQRSAVVANSICPTFTAMSIVLTDLQYTVL